jgi:hypothetical protein
MLFTGIVPDFQAVLLQFISMVRKQLFYKCGIKQQGSCHLQRYQMF